VRVDGEDVAAAGPLELPPDRRRVELAFAAMSYRDPDRVRYRVRLRSDAPWSGPTSEPAFRFAELAPGSYRAEVEASLDGVTWSSEPATLAFTVRAPWWQRPWAYLLAASALAALLALAYRIRVAMQLRLARQRTRIAMDLHDDLGSSLGAIGILASLASNEQIPAAERAGAAADIAETARELGESLGDIVWSLRREAKTLDAMIAHVAERGARLFADSRIELRTELADPIPALPLALAVCRNVQLIAIEALHNAARHTRATSVVLGFARVDHRRWRLWVADDGIGIPADARAGAAAGLGLVSMQSRAREIGARLAIEDTRGTRIELVFAPGGGARMAR
jgi:signal transduction histidine kinase